MSDSNPLNSKKVNEEISVPGMVVKNAGAAKEDNTRIRVQQFSIGVASGEEAQDQAAELEALLNREDVFLLDYHKYTFQHTFHVVVMYSEPRVRS